MLDGILFASAAHRMATHTQDSLAGRQASRTATDVRNRSTAMQGDIEKLFMITEALWDLLKSEHGYSDDTLIDKIQEIDLQDGQLDGKVARSKIKPDCPSCGKKLMGKRPVCLYCGTAVAIHPFDR